MTNLTPLPDERQGAAARPAQCLDAVNASSELQVPEQKYEWLHGSDPQARKALGGGANDAAGHSVFLHPEIINSAPWANEARVLVDRPADSSQAPERTLAVLAPKLMDFRLFPGLWLKKRLRGYRLVGNEFPTSLPLCESRKVLEQIMALVEAEDLDFVYFEDIELASAEYGAIASAAVGNNQILLHMPRNPQPHWWIDIPEPPSDYWKKFSKKTRYNIRSAAKKLDHTLRRVSSKDQVARFLESANAISKASWQAKRMGVRIKNSKQELEHFQKLADIGVLRAYVLESDERPIAFVVALQWEGRFSYEEIAYDSAFADKSPGTVLLLRVLEDLIEHQTPRVFDFGAGDAEYKRIFANRQTSSGPVLIMRRNAMAALVLRTARLEQFVANQFRSRLKGTAFFAWLRKCLRSRQSVP